ncbi:MAG: hypothetical protein J6D54_00615 [Olsenella sp.]|nr:hypothetical protein [Olsenella sp.]
MWHFETAGSGKGQEMEFGDISWLVLDESIDGGRKLLLAKWSTYADWLPEDMDERWSRGGDFSWETSGAREYLNGRFLDEHFSAQERSQVVEVQLDNKGNPFGDDHECSATVDKVFLLSLEEAVKYFADSPGAEELAIVEGNTFYTRTPFDHKAPCSPIRFDSDSQWGEWAGEFDFEDEGSDRSDEIEAAFPGISGLAMNTMSAWVDVSEGDIAVRPALWVSC